MTLAETPPERRGENLISPERPKERYPLITIMGVTGVGKTAVLERLPEFFPDFYIIQEAVDNPFLEGSYKEPEKFSLPSQLFFAKAKYDQVTQIAIPRLALSPVVFEPPFFEDAIYAQERLKRKEWKLYFDFYQGLESNLSIKPDIVVYLTASLENIKKRIMLRAQQTPEEEKSFRRAELLAPDEYWLGLMKKLNDWAKENKEKYIIFTKDTNYVNYVDSYTDEIRFMRELTDDLQDAVFEIIDSPTFDGAQILLPDSLRPRPIPESRAGRVSKFW